MSTLRLGGVLRVLPNYSRVSNNRRVWNNRIGWMFPIKLINVGYGIMNNRIIPNTIGWKFSRNLIIVGMEKAY